MTAGKLTVFWQPDDAPPISGGVGLWHRQVHSVTVAIDHPDPIGLLADALAEAMREFGGPDQHASWNTLEALADHLNAKRASPDHDFTVTDDEYAERAAPGKVGDVTSFEAALLTRPDLAKQIRDEVSSGVRVELDLDD